jgi:hypothetical protein
VKLAEKAKKAINNSEIVELIKSTVKSSTLSELLKPFFIRPPIASEVIYG